MDNVNVSIIIPIYNAEKTLNRCLDALLNQTYKDFEAICIDDGSSDESLKILEEYSKKDSRIKVFSQKNSGVATSRHNAINYSSGKYIMFCDADDWYEPKMIELMVNTIEEQNVDLVECNCNEINLELMLDKEYGQYSRINGFKEVNSKTIPLVSYVLWNKIYKKELLDFYHINYPIKYEHDDTIFNFKYLSVITSMYGITDKLYNYIIGNPNSIMGKLKTTKNKQNRFDFLWIWQDYIDYSMLISDEDKLFYCFSFMNSMVNYFYSLLDSDEKKEFKKNLKLFRRKNKKISKFLFLNNEQLEKKLNFLEVLFSIKNSLDKKHKIITILGIHIKIRRGENNE